MVARPSRHVQGNSQQQQQQQQQQHVRGIGGDEMCVSEKAWPCFINVGRRRRRRCQDFGRLH
eukprot:755109-Hanusia_phi.AAC.2